MLIRTMKEQGLNAQVLPHEDVSLLLLNLKFVLLGVDKVFQLEEAGISATRFLAQGQKVFPVRSKWQSLTSRNQFVAVC